MPPEVGCGYGIFNVDLCECECDLVHLDKLLMKFAAGSCFDKNHICSIKRLPVLIDSENSDKITQFLNSLPSSDPASPFFVPRYRSLTVPIWNSSVTFICPDQISQFQNNIINSTVYLDSFLQLPSTKSPSLTTLRLSTVLPTGKNLPDSSVNPLPLNQTRASVITTQYNLIDKTRTTLSPTKLDSSLLLSGFKSLSLLYIILFCLITGFLTYL